MKRSFSHTEYLYLAFRRIFQKFDHNNIPFTGVAGTDLVCWNLNPQTQLRSLFRSPLPSLRFEEGAKLLGQLEQQFALLHHCEDETLDALSHWSLLCRTYAVPPLLIKKGHHDGRWPIQGCLAGMNTFQHQVNSLNDPLGFLNEEDSNTDDGEALSVDSLAQAVYNKEPKLFDMLHKNQETHHDASLSAHDNNTNYNNSSIPITIKERETLEEQALEAFLEVFKVEHRFKYEPFEWVYDGFKPILFSDVLKRKKGCPAALALLMTAVGEKLGLFLMPMPAEHIESGGEGGMIGSVESSSGGGGGFKKKVFMVERSTATVDANNDEQSPFLLEGLRPELALKLSSRAQSVAPGPGNWVLAIDHGCSGAYINAADGRLMQKYQLLDTYPALQKLETLGRDEETVFLRRWKERSVLRTWQGLCRIAIQAHQRRGESDRVAQWMYVMLALDPEASEWSRALTWPEIQFQSRRV